MSAAVEAFERALIVEALGRCDRNLTPAALALQIPKPTLHDKMKKHAPTVS